MRLVPFCAAFVFVAAALPGATNEKTFADKTAQELLARVPLRFEPNRGQARSPEPVQWLARTPEAAYAFTADGALVRTRTHLLRMRMQGANPAAPFQPSRQLPSPTSYVTTAFRGNVPGYQRLRRANVYPGIDIAYYGTGGRLEYDFEVAAGADAATIRLEFEDAGGRRAHVRVNQSGDLEVGTSESGDADVILQRAPVVYQTGADGVHKEVAASYRVDADGTVRLNLGKYDPAAKLVIDPIIYYTQYFFGSAASPAVAVTHDLQGNVYVTGNTQATDFYIQGNYVNLGNAGGQDAWIMKINPVAQDGNFVPFSTYYGGSNNEIVEGIAVDNNGVAYIAGMTESTDLPTTANAILTALPGQENAFVAAFDTVQVLFTYGTYLGGSLIDDVGGIALFNEKIYVAGTTTSTNFPCTANAIETAPLGGTEVWVSEIDPTQTGTAGLVQSTLIPGSADDAAYAITVDKSGLVYVAGETGSPDFWGISANGVQNTYDQSGDGFVFQMNLQAMQLIYGTYLGGSNLDEIHGVVVDAKGNIGVAGLTLSTDFPATQNAFQTSLAGYMAAFLAVINPSATGLAGLNYATYFGGNFAEAGYSLAIDKNGLYYFCGYTLSSNLPMGSIAAINPTSAGAGIDVFVAQIDTTKGLNGLLYSSYITGQSSQIASSVDVDSNGIIYVVGFTSADIFPAGQAINPNPGILDGYLFAFHP